MSAAGCWCSSGHIWVLPWIKVSINHVYKESCSHLMPEGNYVLLNYVVKNCLYILYEQLLSCLKGQELLSSFITCFEVLIKFSWKLYLRVMVQFYCSRSKCALLQWRENRTKPCINKLLGILELEAERLPWGFRNNIALSSPPEMKWTEKVMKVMWYWQIWDIFVVEKNSMAR